MKTISLGYEGLDADTKATLIKACVDALGGGSIMIDRDESGADITLLEAGDSFVDLISSDGDVRYQSALISADSDAFINMRNAYSRAIESFADIFCNKSKSIEDDRVALSIAKITSEFASLERCLKS